MIRAHLDGLAGLGPRWPGSPSDEAARAYLHREFAATGATVRDLEAQGRRHLIIEIAGRSPDALLLVAPLQALGSSGWVDDSGPALFLELVRMLVEEEPAYTLRFALAALEPVRDEEDEGWIAPAGPLEARHLVLEAGESLVTAMHGAGELERVRAVVVFEPRARPSPTVARDLKSHPVFRAIFWSAAEALGETAAFPSAASWSSPQGLRQAFQDRGFSQIVALVDETIARAELQVEAAPEKPAANRRRRDAEGASSSGLGPLGRVSLEGLSRLMGRFEKVDAFTR